MSLPSADNMIQFLEIAVSVIYFINKIFLSLDKNSGWIVGILASFCGVYYFYLLGSPLLVSLELAFVFVQIMGFYNRNQKNLNPVIIYGSLLGIITVLFFVLKNSTFLEFFTSAVFIVGIYFMAIHQKKWAWLLLITGHISMSTFAYSKGLIFFLVFQSLSVLVGFFALYRIYKASKTNPF
jgi:hypothetical protein